MTTTTLSSRDLNADLGRAKRAAKKGPVIITDHGKPAHVLLSFEQYQKITGQQESLLEALSKPEGIGDIEIEFSRVEGMPGQVDLS